MSDAECRRLARALAADPSDETVLEALMAAERRAGVSPRVRAAWAGRVSVVRWGASSKSPPRVLDFCILGVGLATGGVVEAWPVDQFGEGLGLEQRIVAEILPGTDGVPWALTPSAETQPPSVVEDAPRSPASSPPPPAPAPVHPARPRPRAGSGRTCTGVQGVVTKNPTRGRRRSP